MTNLKRIIFLHLIFSEECVKKSLAVSPAANLWQDEFVKGIKKLKIECFFVGHKYETIFPRGSFFVSTGKNDLLRNISCKTFNYVNLPYIKNFFLKRKYYYFLKNFDFKKGDIIVTYNDSFVSDVALILNKNFNIPWVSIVADLKAPQKANGHVYLNWEYFKKTDDQDIKIHIDGGINQYPINSNILKNNKKKIILYAGTIGGHGGTSYLIRAFNKVKNNDVELWLCGKGKDNEIIRYIDKDKRIKLFGYVSKKKLEELCKRADIFVNPRNSNGNNTNFPSKILFYLTFKKPIISTKSGLSPKYNDILFLLDDENINTLTNTINQVFSINQAEKKILKNKMITFIKNNSWDIQAKKFITWVNKEINFK